jgi:hypothetical protein
VRRYYSYEEAAKLDKIVLSHIDWFDQEGLNRDLKNGGCEAGSQSAWRQSSQGSQTS